jgi:hypothetical protein
MAGIFLRLVLPAHHLDNDSRDIVKLCTGLVATIAALVLSLLISSAKTSFDKMNDELIQSSAKLILLDRTLAAYGPETRDVRDLLKRHYTAAADLLFSGDKSKQARLDSPETVARVEGVRAQLRQLSPRNEDQRALQSQALAIFGEMAATRWLLLMQAQEPIPMPLLMVLVFWLAVIFAAFGLFAPRNATVIVTLFIAALCATGALFLILEMNQPLGGFVRLSGAPLRSALTHLGE